MKTLNIKYLIFTSLMAGSLMAASAQQDSTKLRKEVEVVKAYQPTISDAYKINTQPQITPQQANKPVFEYQIKTQPTMTSFQVEPVQAAAMKAERLAPMENGLFKLGAGNYTTQYGELFLNAKAGRSSTLGFHWNSYLSNGKLKLKNNDKVKAPYNKHLFEFFTDHDLGGSTLSTKAYFEHQSFRYYGYTGSYLNDLEKADSIPDWNLKQAFNKAGISLQFAQKPGTKADINVNTGLGYQYFDTKTGQRENAFKWNGTFKAPILLMEGVFDAGISYNHTNNVYSDYEQALSKRDQLILRISPAAVFDSQYLKFKIGVNTYTAFDRDEKTNYMITPSASINFTAIENWLSLYAAADGYLKENNYSAIASENPFVRYDQNLKNTKYRYILTGGIKGKITENLNYGLQVDYANVKNQYFYYLNYLETTYAGTTETFRNNTFDVAYDRSKELTLGGELHYALNQELNFRLKAAYHNYATDSLQHAFLKPSFESTASAYYDPEGPFRFTADLYIVGSRKALIQTTHHNLDDANSVDTYSQQISSMPTVIDLNLGVEYRFNRSIGLWGRTNNFTSKKYELFPGYMNQGLNFMMGASLNF